LPELKGISFCALATAAIKIKNSDKVVSFI
jgi:hypothetical protein